MPTLKDDVIKSFKGKHCSTCEQWQGRKPRCAGHWAGVKEVENAAYCEDDKAWHGATDYCEDYSPLPGSPMWNREEKRKIKTPKLSNKEIESESKMNRDGEINSEDQEDDEYVDEQSEENVEYGICDNKIFVEVVVAPQSGSVPLQYVVTEIVCDQVPFIGQELMSGLRVFVGNNTDDLVCVVKEKIKLFLEAYGFDIDVVIKSSMASGYCITRDDSYVNFINLFVDMGSTNCKWIVTRADKKGTSKGFVDIPVGKSTKDLCMKWGIDYDKSMAYQLSKNDFVVWLGYAVLGFMLKIMEKYKAKVVNLKWSFPCIIDGKKIYFDEVSNNLAEMLRPYGLIGTFELVPEGIALASMFKNRLEELASASDGEEMENRRREKQEEENHKYNLQEKRKEKNANAARRREAEEWKKEHWFKRVFCDPDITTPKYTACLRNESLGREEDLKEFRATGARADGNFNLLILDAGGSTLDYYYKPISGKISTGSFTVGGKDVTRKLAEDLSIDIEDAEERKKVLSKASSSKILLSATEAVYKDSLRAIFEITEGVKPLCVVASGLGMCNSQLRLLLAQKLSLPKNQRIIYSPDIVNLFPKSKYSTFPGFKEFADIVGRVVENGSQSSLPWPGSDVCGGMYFKKES